MTQYRKILTGSLLLLLTGCGLFGYDYVYNRIDKLLANRIEQVLNLTSTQTDRLTASLKAFHRQHRLTELPYYPAYFDYVSALTQDGLTEEEAESILKNFDILYARLVSRFIPTLITTLSELDNAQLTDLQTQFTEYNDERARESGVAAPEERLRTRIDRHRKAYAFWLGNLTEQQVTLIENNAENYPDIEPLWHNRRMTMQQSLLTLLRQRADSDTLEEFLYRWWVDGDDKPPALAEAEHRAGRHIITLTVSLFEKLEPKQKTHLQNKLDALARSLEELVPVESHPQIALHRKAFLHNEVQLSDNANCFNVAADNATSSC